MAVLDGTICWEIESNRSVGLLTHGELPLLRFQYALYYYALLYIIFLAGIRGEGILNILLLWLFLRVIEHINTMK